MTKLLYFGSVQLPIKMNFGKNVKKVLMFCAFICTQSNLAMIGK